MPPPDDPLPDLIAALRHKTPSVRLGAVKSLGKLGWLAREALPALTATADDGDGKVREAAAAAIASVGPDALPALAGLLGHPDKYVRRQAVWGLGKLGPAAKPLLLHLCRALNDEDPRTACGAAQALGNMGAEAGGAVAALAEAMRGTNVVLCRMAAKALSQVGPPAIPTIMAHLRHHDPFVRSEAAVAVGWVGPTAAAAVLPLADVLRTSHPSSRPETTTPTPGEATPPTAVNNAAAEPLPAEDACRVNAATALGRIGPAAAAAIPALEEARKDAVEAVRKAAELSLRSIRGRAES